MDQLPVDECWEWPGARDAEGYGKFSAKRAHRLAYEMLVAPIPVGLTVDHLCLNKGCVNPAHMEIVTFEENSRRMHAQIKAAGLKPAMARHQAAKTHCPQGHPLSGENLRIDAASGARRCRICDAAKSRRYQARRRSA